jgi:hypothetical protein
MDRASSESCSLRKAFDRCTLVWGYARDSGEDTEDVSAQHQTRAMEDHCDRVDLALVQVFQDEATPGGLTVGRDALDDLIHLAHQEPPPLGGYPRLVPQPLRPSSPGRTISESEPPPAEV